MTQSIRRGGDPLESFDPRWYARLFDRLGARYDELAFTRGAEQEAGFLIDELGLAPGDRVLDIGCGTARHAVELAARGLTVTGVDLSSRLLEVGLATARRRQVLVNLMHADAREIGFHASFDAALSLCQGAFGLLEDDRQDRLVLERMRAALKDGGRLALNALNRLHIASRPGDFPGYDPATGYTDQSEMITLESGQSLLVRYRDRAYDPDELAVVVEAVGFKVSAIYGSRPGEFGRHPAGASHPELLLVAEAR